VRAPLDLTLLPSRFSVSILPPDSAIPAWAATGEVVSITRTDEELSIVCEESRVPADMQAERGWRCLKVAGPIDFSQVGVVASLAGPLAEAEIPIFVISTYLTDYLLVKEESLQKSIECLQSAGHTLTNPLE
jgi:hypothetical protein